MTIEPDDETDVLIAGAGPVGATLALDLARRSLRVLVLERNASPRRLPKMERCNGGRFRDGGLQVSAAELGAAIREETAAVAEMIKAAGVVAE